MFIIIDSIDYERSTGNIINNSMTINLILNKMDTFLKRHKL